MNNNKNEFINWFFSTCLLIGCAILLLPLFLVINSILFFGGIETDISDVTSITRILFCFSLPMVISLVLFPYYTSKKIYKLTNNDLGLCLDIKNSISFFICCIIAMISCILFFLHDNSFENYHVVFSFLFVGFTEEFFFRGVLYAIFNQKLKPITALIITSLIFSVLFHSTDSVANNLIFRFPIGLLLGIIRIKTKNIYSASLIHFAYNLLVNSF